MLMWTEFNLSLLTTIRGVAIDLWRLRLAEYLVEHRVPARIAHFVALHLPEGFLLKVVARHDALNRTPEQLMAAEPEVYARCLGNFWGMIYDDLVRLRII